MQARMRQMSLFAVIAVVSVVILGGPALAQSDRTLGTWKVNLAKSKYEPGPPPTSDTRVLDAWETDGIKFRVSVWGRTAPALLWDSPPIMTGRITTSRASGVRPKARHLLEKRALPYAI